VWFCVVLRWKRPCDWPISLFPISIYKGLIQWNSPSRETSSYSASSEIPRILCNQLIAVSKNRPPEPDQSTPRISMLQFHPWIWNKYVEICSLLGYSARYSGNSLTTFRENFQGWTNPRSFLDLFTDRLSRNFGEELLPYYVLYPRRAQISSTSRRKPEITEPIISPKRRYQASNLSHVTFQKSKSLKLHCISVLPSTPDSSKWSLSSSFA